MSAQASGAAVALRHVPEAHWLPTGGQVGLIGDGGFDDLAARRLESYRQVNREFVPGPMCRGTLRFDDALAVLQLFAGPQSRGLPRRASVRNQPQLVPRARIRHIASRCGSLLFGTNEDESVLQIGIAVRIGICEIESTGGSGSVAWPHTDDDRRQVLVAVRSSSGVSGEDERSVNQTKGSGLQQYFILTKT